MRTARSWPVLPGTGQLVKLAGGVPGAGDRGSQRWGVLRAWRAGVAEERAGVVARSGWCAWCGATAVPRFARVSPASVSGRGFRYLEVIAEVPALAERMGSPG